MWNHGATAGVAWAAWDVDAGPPGTSLQPSFRPRVGRGAVRGCWRCCAAPALRGRRRGPSLRKGPGAIALRSSGRSGLSRAVSWATSIVAHLVGGAGATLGPEGTGLLPPSRQLAVVRPPELAPLLRLPERPRRPRPKGVVHDEFTVLIDVGVAGGQTAPRDEIVWVAEGGGGQILVATGSEHVCHGAAATGKENRVPTMWTCGCACWRARPVCGGPRPT